MTTFSDAVEQVAESYYARMTYVPASYRAAFEIRSQPTWSQLPERDRQHYRNLVQPVVADTLKFGSENGLPSDLFEVLLDARLSD